MLRAINTVVFTGILALGMSGLAFADHDDYHGSQQVAQDQGYQHGYSKGYHEGLKDRDHHNQFKPNVGDTDDGYQKSMGDKGQYKEGYRSGFMTGYNDAFSNRPERTFEEPYNRGYETRGNADRVAGYGADSRVASDIGYQDGLHAGQADYNRHHAARPEDQDDYRHADHGYRDQYGDKGIYQQQYRDAFVQGYRDAYSGRR